MNATEVEHSVGFVLSALDERLRRRSDRPVRVPLQVAALLLMDWQPGEIRSILGLSRRQYGEARRRLVEVMRPDVDEA